MVRSIVFVALSIIIFGAAVGSGWLYRDSLNARDKLDEAVNARAIAEGTAREVVVRLAAERDAKEAVEHALKTANEKLTRERPRQKVNVELANALKGRLNAENSIKMLTAQLELNARNKLDAALNARREKVVARPLQKTNVKLADALKAKEAAEKSVKILTVQFEQASSAKETAESALKLLRAKFAEERSDKEAAEKSVKAISAKLDAERSAKEATATPLKELGEKLEKERSARKEAENSFNKSSAKMQAESKARAVSERALKDVAQKLADARKARAASQRTMKELNAKLSEARKARDASERTTQEVNAKLSEARKARAASVRTLEDVNALLVKERGAREAAERTLKNVTAQLESSSKPSASQAVSLSKETEKKSEQVVATSAVEKKRSNIKTAVLADDQVKKPEAAAEPKPDPIQLARIVQTELKRVGCYPGNIDGIWGRGAQSAMRRFNRYTKSKLSDRKPTVAAMAALKVKVGAVCPKRVRRKVQSVNKKVESSSGPSAFEMCLEDCKLRFGDLSYCLGHC